MRTLLARTLAILAALAAVPAHAQNPGDSLTTRAPRTFAFGADRAERCTWFLITEFSASLTNRESAETFDRVLFTDAVGLARNVGRSQAIGLSLDAHLADGNLRILPTLRVRQWLAGRQSLELAVGYATDQATQEGVVGPVVALRYGPSAWFHVQAGTTRVRDVSSITYFPEPHVEAENRRHFHGGLGVGGVGGVIAWGAQAIAFAALVAMMSGMS